MSMFLSFFDSLHTAARQGKVELLKELLQRNSNPDLFTKLGWTPLHFAARYGQLECCRLLLDAGASIIATTKLRGYMPIHLAALYDQVDIVDFLLQRGNDRNVCTLEGWTPLHAAVEHANVLTVRFLLEKGADPNRAKRKSGAVFPLHTAAENGRTDIVQILLDAGANPCVRDKHGFYPVDYALKNGFTHLEPLLVPCDTSGSFNLHKIKKLFSFDDLRCMKIQSEWVNHQANIREHSVPLLQFAICECRSDVVLLLLEKWEPIPHKQWPYFGNVLNFAALHWGRDLIESDKIVKILLEHGVQLTRFGPILDQIEQGLPVSPTVAKLLEGHCARIDPVVLLNAQLCWAVDTNDCSEAEKQIRAGANVNGRTGSTCSPLERAVVEQNNAEMARLLLRYGADVHRRTYARVTLLYHAVKNKNLEMVKILVEAGARPGRKEKRDYSPLYLAMESGQEEIAAYLRERGAEIDTGENVSINTSDRASSVLFRREQKEDIYSIQKLSAPGVDLFQLNQFRQTLLHLIAANGSTETVAWLLDQGLKVDAIDINGNTPLHVSGTAETARLLIENGANIYLRTSSRRLALETVPEKVKPFLREEMARIPDHTGTPERKSG